MSEELDEVLARLAALVAEHSDAPDEPEPEGGANFRCVDCSGCSDCRFCTACEGCVDCTYCDACSECESCTQSRECHACSRCLHSSYSAYSQSSSYLVLCYDCETCVHCFACVGLADAEFCVLNEKLSRREYFATVARLRVGLDARSLEGWRPPWIETDVVTPTSVAADTLAAALEMAVASEPRLAPARDSERTGSFPPLDHRSARAMDASLEDGLWDAIGDPWDGSTAMEEGKPRPTAVGERSEASPPPPPAFGSASLVPRVTRAVRPERPPEVVPEPPPAGVDEPSDPPLSIRAARRPVRP